MEEHGGITGGVIPVQFFQLQWLEWIWLFLANLNVIFTSCCPNFIRNEIYSLVNIYIKFTFEKGKFLLKEEFFILECWIGLWWNFSSVKGVYILLKSNSGLKKYFSRKMRNDQIFSRKWKSNNEYTKFFQESEKSNPKTRSGGKASRVKIFQNCTVYRQHEDL